MAEGGQLPLLSPPCIRLLWSVGYFEKLFALRPIWIILFCDVIIHGVDVKSFLLTNIRDNETLRNSYKRYHKTRYPTEISVIVQLLFGFVHVNKFSKLLGINYDRPYIEDIYLYIYTYTYASSCVRRKSKTFATFSFLLCFSLWNRFSYVDESLKHLHTNDRNSEAVSRTFLL